MIGRLERLENDRKVGEVRELSGGEFDNKEGVLVIW